jgi:hypothetical protein
MELHEYAAREVSALVDRIVSDAEGRARALIDGSQREHDAAMNAVRLELETQARKLDAHARESEAQAGALEAQGRQLETQTRELEARLRENDHLAAAAEDTRSQLAALRRELDAQRADVQSARQEAELQRGLADANMSASLELLEARAALESSRTETQRLTRQFETTLEDLRNEHLQTLQQQAVARTALPLDELRTMFDALAKAASPSAVLTTIVTGLGREFSRVALFRVRGARLECVKHVGFEFEGDVAKVMIPVTLDCLMTRAVNSRETQTFVSGKSQEPCAVPFGGTPACAVALPLISGDASVAVIYADDSDLLEFGSVPAELLVKFADLVWQHAVLVLQRMSAAQKMLAISPVQNFERLA